MAVKTPSKTTVGIALVAAQVVVGPLTLRDISRRSQDEIRGPRLIWKLWAGTNLAGAAAYWLVGRKKTGKLSLSR